MKTIFLSAILLMCSAVSLSAAGLTGRDVMLKAKNRPDGDTRYATLTMTLIQKNGNRRERKLVSWAMDVGKDSKRVMFFTYPGDVKGTGLRRCQTRRRPWAISARHEEDATHQREIVENRLFHG